MKKKSFKSLKLNKTPISKLDRAKGGMLPPPPPGLTENLCWTLIPEICYIQTGDSHIVCETQQIECNVFTQGC